MIYARIKEDTGYYNIDIRGHAGSAEIGHDIICASVSIIAYTVAQVARDLDEQGKLNKHPTIVLDSGNACVTLMPKKEYYDDVKQLLYFAKTGLKLLQSNFPQYVELTTVCKG